MVRSELPDPSSPSSKRESDKWNGNPHDEWDENAEGRGSQDSTRHVVGAHCNRDESPEKHPDTGLYRRVSRSRFEEMVQKVQGGNDPPDLDNPMWSDMVGSKITIDDPREVVNCCYSRIYGDCQN